MYVLTTPKWLSTLILQEGKNLSTSDGIIDLGSSALKDMRLANGPQTALAVGATYNSPQYWRLGLSANYLAQNFIGLSSITRTDSFL